MSDALGFALVLASPLLPEAVRAASRAPVVAVDERTPVERGQIYVIPAGRGVRFVDGHLVPGDGDCASARLDALLRSVADEIGARTTAAVLAGRGRDGALGLQRIKEVGGWTLAEDVVGEHAEMPRAAIAAGLVDLVLPIDQLAERLVTSAAARDGGELDADPEEAGAAGALRGILALIQLRSGHDVSVYRRAALVRRIARRMQICGVATFAAYHDHLCDRPGELANLLRDLWMSATQFFRDPATFETIARDVAPRLFSGKQAGDPVRIWIAGCATGEEAYSFGIVLLEHAARLRSAAQIQIFATDIDHKALAFARQGCYPGEIALDVAPARLQRFFVRDDSGYRVHDELRKLVVFASHDLLRDPPFPRLDLISCRNLLIDLERDARRRALTAFHFGLRGDGVLLLGASDCAEDSQLFATIDREHRVLVRRPPPRSLGGAIPRAGRRQSPGPAAPPPPGELHHRLVEHYAPASALVDDALDLIHFSDSAGRYLQVDCGEPTRQLLRLVHRALRSDLCAAIHGARRHGVDTRIARFDDDGARSVEIRVRAVNAPELGPGALLVMFAEREPADDLVQVAVAPSVEPAVRELEAELHRTRERLRTTVQQYETSLEELKASNEELQVINDELRYATEELEISKHELQSVNEELLAVNQELKVKIDEVSRAHSDLQNLMTSTDIGVVFLDRQLRIQRFTPRAQDLFNVIASDVGRPLAHFTHRVESETLSQDMWQIAQSVLDTVRPVERELRSHDGRCYLARWLPYRSIEDRIDGVVLTFVDVTDLRDAAAARRRSEEALQQVEERLQVALRSAPLAALGFETAGAAPGALVATWGFLMGRELDAGERADLPMLAPGHGEWLRAGVRQAIAERTGQRAELELVIDAMSRTFDFRIEPTASGATAVGFDITPSKVAEVSLREADRRKDEFLATLSHELRNPLMPLQVALDTARLLDDDPRQRAHSLSIMERQIAMLTTLVNELLDLSRVTQGKIVLERAIVSLAHALESAVVATKPMFEAAQHELRIDVPDGPIEIDGDFRRLVQVFTNLLSNAAKYTPPSGHIDVAVLPGPASVAVRVQDDGLGITSDMLPRIFDIFVQSHDVHGRSQGGLGIGLNLVRRLVELHGGTVTVASAGAGHGSAFTVELPLRAGGTPS